MDEYSKPYTIEEANYHNVFDAENRGRQEWLRYFFLSGNCLCHPSVLIRKEVYKDCGMIVEGLWQLPDFYKWIRLCLKYSLYILEDRLVNFRIHRTNISGEYNLENILRRNNELYQIYELFYEVDEQDFLAVFKEAKKFVVKGKINHKFALSKLLLEQKAPAAQTLGLNKLFEMLNHQEERQQIMNLYNYDDVSYKIDETRYSPFVLPNLANSLSIYNAKLYLDFGDGFNERDVITTNFITDANQNFHVGFGNIDALCGGKKLKALRFDPCDFGVKIQMQKVMSSGKKLNYDINRTAFLPKQYMKYGDYDVFFSNDPSYIIKGYEDSISNLSISGRISVLQLDEAIDLKDTRTANPIIYFKECFTRIKNNFKK